MAAASPDPATPIPVVVRSWVDAVVANLAGWIAGRATAHLDPATPRLRLAELYQLIEPRAVVLAGGLTRPGPDVTVIDPAAPGTHPDAVVHGPDPTDTSALVFTSGSTGRPKGVASSFGALRARSEALLEAYDFCPDDRIGLTLAPSFGAAAFVFTGPCWGASLHLMDPTPGTRSVADWLAAADITLAVVAPHLMRDLIDLFGPGSALPRLRLIAPMADKVYGDDVRGVWATMNPEARITGQYGSTECGPITVFDHRPGTEVRDGPSGRGSTGPRRGGLDHRSRRHRRRQDRGAHHRPGLGVLARPGADRRPVPARPRPPRPADPDRRRLRTHGRSGSDLHGPSRRHGQDPGLQRRPVRDRAAPGRLARGPRGHRGHRRARSGSHPHRGPRGGRPPGGDGVGAAPPALRLAAPLHAARRRRVLRRPSLAATGARCWSTSSRPSTIGARRSRCPTWPRRPGSRPPSPRPGSRCWAWPPSGPTTTSTTWAATRWPWSRWPTC